MEGGAGLLNRDVRSCERGGSEVGDLGSFGGGVYRVASTKPGVEGLGRVFFIGKAQFGDLEPEDVRAVHSEHCASLKLAAQQKGLGIQPIPIQAELVVIVQFNRAQHSTEFVILHCEGK